MSENLTDDSAVERALRAGLEEYDLSDEDRALLDGGRRRRLEPRRQGPLPVVAVVGRPNVGKSTLVNRILGRREAVVEDVPGVTRDRVAYDAEWSGRRFTARRHRRLGARRRRASRRASPSRPRSRSTLADVGAVRRRRHRRRHRRPTRPSCRLLRRSGKPVVLVANKVDDQRTEADAAALWSLGPRRAVRRSRPCTGGAAATCSTPSSTCCPRSPRTPAPTSVAARAGWPWSAGPTSASPACSTSWPGTSGSSSTASPARRATRSTSSSSSAARPGASSTPPASGAGCTRPRAPTSTPRCAPRPRSRRPRSPSC